MHIFRCVCMCVCVCVCERICVCVRVYVYMSAAFQAVKLVHECLYTNNVF